MTPVETLPAPVARRFESLRRLIGDTPLVELDCRVRGRRARVFAKLETGNFTGSIKDRMALRILEEAWERGDVREGTEIVEVTSGNTGIALAGAGRALGHPVRVYMPDYMSRERVQTIQSLGATVVLVSAEEGGFRGSLELAERYAAEAGPRVFLTHQFACAANPAAHEEHTGPELVQQMERAGARPAAFVAGVGTGGTVMGVGRCLRARFPGVRVHPLEPANSPTLRAGRRVGKHRIQGISDEFVPPIVDLAFLDEVVDVWDGDAILAAQRLAGELGLRLGISSGANLVGALAVAAELEEGAPVATVFADSSSKYLSTDLMGEEPVREEYWTPHVVFDTLRIHARPSARG